MKYIRDAFGVVILLFVFALLAYYERVREPYSIVYELNYPLTSQQLDQVVRNKGAWVMVDTFKYGDNAKPYEKVVHCKIFEDDRVYCDVQEVGK